MNTVHLIVEADRKTWHGVLPFSSKRASEISFAELFCEQNRNTVIQAIEQTFSGQIVKIPLLHLVPELASQESLRDGVFLPFRGLNGEVQKLSFAAFSVGLPHETSVQRVSDLEHLVALARGLAHDFNNSLSITIGYAEKAMGPSLTADEVKKSLEISITAGREAAVKSKNFLVECKKFRETSLG